MICTHLFILASLATVSTASSEKKSPPPPDTRRLAHLTGSSDSAAAAQLTAEHTALLARLVTDDDLTPTDDDLTRLVLLTALLTDLTPTTTTVLAIDGTEYARADVSDTAPARCHTRAHGICEKERRTRRGLMDGGAGGGGGTGAGERPAKRQRTDTSIKAELQDEPEKAVVTVQALNGQEAQVAIDLQSTTKALKGEIAAGVLGFAVEDQQLYCPEAYAAEAELNDTATLAGQGVAAGNTILCLIHDSVARASETLAALPYNIPLGSNYGSKLIDAAFAYRNERSTLDAAFALSTTRLLIAADADVNFVGEADRAVLDHIYDYWVDERDDIEIYTSQERVLERDYDVDGNDELEEEAVHHLEALDAKYKEIIDLLKEAGAEAVQYDKDWAPPPLHFQLPDGWEEYADPDTKQIWYGHADGREQDEHPWAIIYEASKGSL